MDHSNSITKAQCQKVLERYTGSTNFQIKSYTVSALESLEGLMCVQYFLKINYQIDNEESSAQFFFKILIEANPVMYELSRTLYAYEKESFYYETVVPLLKSKGLNVNYVPHSYFSEPYVIVLEDLTLRDFKGFGKGKPLDVLHCKKSLEVLAKFHADPILFELEKSKELGKKYSFLDEFGDVVEDRYYTDKYTNPSKFMHCSVRSLYHIIDLIPDNGISKSDFKSAMEIVLKKLLSSQQELKEFRSTLLHSDLWSNNFLYQYNEDGSEIKDCILIDFQFLRYAPPALDVFQFLFTNTRRAFRDQHQQELLDHYYNVLSGSFSYKGYKPSEVLSEDDFRKSCKACAIIAKTMSIIDRSITFISDANYEDVAHDAEEFTKYLYEDREEYVVKAFNTNSEFREVMVEDITDLRAMIFCK